MRDFDLFVMCDLSFVGQSDSILLREIRDFFLCVLCEKLCVLCEKLCALCEKLCAPCGKTIEPQSSQRVTQGTQSWARASFALNGI